MNFNSDKPENIEITQIKLEIKIIKGTNKMLQSGLRH